MFLIKSARFEFMLCLETILTMPVARECFEVVESTGGIVELAATILLIGSIEYAPL